MKLPYKIGTVVRVIVDHPDGSSECTRDQIGIVTSVNYMNPDNPDYTVKTKESDYLYGETQIVPATANEVRQELARLLTQYTQED